MSKQVSAIELKDADPVDTVSAALDELTKSVDERLTAVETKSANVADASELSEVKASLAKIEAKLSRPGIITEKKEETFAARVLKAFTSYLRFGSATPAEELKALTVSNDPQGGYLAPPEMSTEFIRDLVEFSPIRSLASVRNTGAPSVTYPKRTGITNAKWKGETQAAEASEPAFGQAEIIIREVNTYVDISNQLLADSAGAAETEVRLALAEDFGQKEGIAFLHGDGVLAPAGILQESAIEHTLNGHATDLDDEALISLMYATPAAYRNRGTWLMNGTTLATIRKLKDGAGNYLWQPSYAAGQPETILGRPVVEAEDMPAIEANAFPILFGDFTTAYRIVDRSELSILVNPYILATNGITRIHATRRVGAGVVQAKALRKLKMATA